MTCFEEKSIVKAAETASKEICKKIKLDDTDKTYRLRSMFSKCFINTVNTTVKLPEGANAFVITGDIEAMWLRDSSAQVLQYLRFMPEYPTLRDFVKSLIQRQYEYILHDPYANAFMEKETCVSKHAGDLTDAGKLVWERKFEIDSLCYPIWLLHEYTKYCPDAKNFPNVSLVSRGVEKILDVFETELDHSKSTYTFQRLGRRPTDTLVREGKGPEFAVTGMIWSGFRPSDDACTYSYLVPANFFAAKVMAYVTEMSAALEGGEALASRAAALRESILKGISKFAVVDTAKFGKVYAYEVDGRGNSLLMDDANVPSLLALPWMECDYDEEIYANTRRMLLSSDNPYYFAGKEAAGIGSPHTGADKIWPIALVTEGLTETSHERQLEILDTLMSTTADTGFMHESFNKDDQKDFTRSWFAWANSYFSYFVDKLF